MSQEPDFVGGSMDDIEDALEILNRGQRPYIMFLLSSLDDGRAVSHLTPKSRALFQNLHEAGALNEILDTILQLSEEGEEDEEED